MAERVTDIEHTTPRVVTILALVLERLVARNDQIAEANEAGRKMKVFDGVRAPSISVLKYLERLYKYANCSPSCFVVGYVYMDRLLHRHPQLLVVSLNVHRLLVTAVMLASKMLDDDHCDNAFYARVGGVSKAEMNRLELELLFLLDFDLMVTAPDLEIYCLYLERELPRLDANGCPVKVERPLTPIAGASANLTGTSTINIDEYEDLVHEFSIQLDEQS